LNKGKQSIAAIMSNFNDFIKKELKVY